MGGGFLASILSGRTSSRSVPSPNHSKHILTKQKHFCCSASKFRSRARTKNEPWSCDSTRVPVSSENCQKTPVKLLELPWTQAARARIGRSSGMARLQVWEERIKRSSEAVNRAARHVPSSVEPDQIPHEPVTKPENQHPRKGKKRGTE